MKYLDYDGLQRFWQKIKTALNGKANANHTHSYDDLSNKPTIPSYNTATTSTAGLMSAADKKKLDGLDNDGDGVSLTIW